MADPHTIGDSNSSAPARLIEQEIVGLYQQHAAALCRYAASFAKNQDGARDAVQEVFLRYFIERRYGREIGNPRAWLYHVLRNYMVDWQRSVANREISADDLDHLPGNQQNPERLLQRSEAARDLESLLTEREFECLRLRAEGLDYAEIAAVMGIRSGTVGALLARAQKKIRRSADNNRRAALGPAGGIQPLFGKREAYS